MNDSVIEATANDLLPAVTFLDGKVTLRGGDCRDVIKRLPDNSIDAVCTDPPYGILFMGRAWDAADGTPFAKEFWAEVYRVLKPGGHVAAFSGTRTYHRMAVAIEDAGFEVRDQLAWMYGSGFPKSHDVSKAIDKALGAEREVVGKKQAGIGSGKTFGMLQSEGDNASAAKEVDVTAPATPEAAQWQGYGTALKPAWEPICLARKPLSEKTVAANVLAHGTGALNIDGCRVGTDGGTSGSNYAKTGQFGIGGKCDIVAIDAGRWPANIVHDGSDEVLAGFPDSKSTRAEVTSNPGDVYGGGAGLPSHTGIYGFDDSGSAARFFYTAKADKLDRIGSKHPTVKPVDLMQWLCRLVTPPGGRILDPFAGSGSTGEAAWREGFDCVLIEREPEYQADIAERLKLADKGPMERKARAIRQTVDHGPLFGGANDNVAGGGKTQYVATVGQ